MDIYKVTVDAKIRITHEVKASSIKDAENQVWLEIEDSYLDYVENHIDCAECREIEITEVE